MTCKRGKASPDQNTKLRLFADAGGFCQNPGCNEYLFFGENEGLRHFAELAHIISASDTGPRADIGTSKEDRGKYENIILLCPNCHTKADKDEVTYSDAVLSDWKQSHVDQLNNLFSIKRFETRDDLIEKISPILAENETIHTTYGPDGEWRFNPESEMPLQWTRKIHTSILPNNRHVLLYLDNNRHLLSDDEQKCLELLRQHVDDFEAKHVDEIECQGIMFPECVRTLFEA